MRHHRSHATGSVLACALVVGIAACGGGSGGSDPATGNAGADGEHQAAHGAAPTALPSGADAATRCTDPTGDTGPAAGADGPDLTDVSMVSAGDTVVVAFAFSGPPPTRGDLVLAVEASSDDGRTVRQLGVKLHDGQPAGAFVGDSSGAVTVQLADVVHVADRAVHAGFPVATITDLGPTWHWYAVVGNADRIDDLCPGGADATISSVGSVSVG